MAIRVHPDVLDKGLNEIKNFCNKLILVDQYNTSDSYATVTTTSEILAEVDMTNADFTLSDGGTGRRLTSAAGKKDNSANNAGDGVNNHFVFLDTVNSRILWVTNETSGQNIVQGNGITFPSLQLTFNQPIAV